jgi:excisionase family DNA binding protein
VAVESPDSRGYAKVRTAAKYADISERTLRTWLKEGLPHLRLHTGTILIAYRDVDSWLEQFRVDGSEVDAIVDEVMKGLNSSNKK